MAIYFFRENYVTSEGTISHNVFYYQPLPITHCQVRFYANNYFEYLPIVSTAFKQLYEIGPRWLANVFRIQVTSKSKSDDLSWQLT